MEFNTIEDAIDDIRRGRIVIVVDDEDRENEGDFTIAAEMISPETINFMAKYGRGLICLAMTGEHLDRLQLPLMVETNTSKFGTAFTVSIDAKEGVTSGISASDRSVTILTAIDPDCRSDSLVRPGHVFPLRARPGGVLERAGQTEASVDLARLAGLRLAGVICEILNEDGTMARVPELRKVAADHNIKIVTVAELIAFRLRTETFVHKVADANLPTEFGDFIVSVFENSLNQEHHLALIKGEISPDVPALVRVQSQSTIGDVFHALTNDQQAGIHSALKMIQKADSGIFVYLRQEGCGAGLAAEIRSIVESRTTTDELNTMPPGEARSDPRVYGIGAQILRQLGARRIRLITDHPRRIIGLHGYGITVVDRIPLSPPLP